MEPNVSNELPPQNPVQPQPQLQNQQIPQNVTKRSSLPIIFILLLVFLVIGMVLVILFYKQNKPQIQKTIVTVPAHSTPLTYQNPQSNTITPSVYLMPSNPPTSGPFPQSYEAVLDSIQLPSDFKLIASIPGNEGVSGTHSLEKKYAVQGTRESILKELEPAIDKIGYNLTENATHLDTTHAGYKYDYYVAVNKYLASIGIWLKPDYPDQPASYNKPTMSVTEVDMLLSGL